jgi:hypothetical protein
MTVVVAPDKERCCYIRWSAFLPTGSSIATDGGRCCSERGAELLQTMIGLERHFYRQRPTLLQQGASMLQAASDAPGGERRCYRRRPIVLLARSSVATDGDIRCRKDMRVMLPTVL